MRNPKRLGLRITMASMAMLAVLAAGGCSNEKALNKAKESAAKYWQDKAYPGKSYDVQVIEAEKTSDGTYRVKGIVDGETRVGTYSPESETFSEGFYSLAHEREKRIAELEQEVKYWKEKSEAQDKELYKLKVRMDMMRGKKPDVSEDDSSESAPPPAASAPSAPAPAAAKPPAAPGPGAAIPPPPPTPPAN